MIEQVTILPRAAITCAEFGAIYEVLAEAILAGGDPTRLYPDLWRHACACPRCGLALVLLLDLQQRCGGEDGPAWSKMPGVS